MSLRFLLVVATAAIWLVSGLVDREPWKADEGYSFGLVYSMIEHGQWLVPTLAGEPFMEKPPLVYWVAAFTAWLTSGWLPLHVGARVANGLFGLAAFVAVLKTGELTLGRRRRWLPVLMLAGTPAYLLATRYLTADLGLFLGCALVLLGLVRTARHRSWGGVLTGIGAAVGLMSKGLLLPGVAALTWGLSVALLPVYRSRWGRAQAMHAVLWFLMLGLPWPMLLQMRHPDLWWVWFWDNNFGRYFGANELGPPTKRWLALPMMIAVLAPALPMALVSLWRRPHLWHAPRWKVVVLFGSVWALALLGSSTLRALYMVPMAIPCAILGCAALPHQVPGRWSASRRWVLSVALLLLCVGAVILYRREGLDSGLDVSWAWLCVTAAVLAAWIWRWCRRGAPRPLALWAITLTLGFMLLISVFLHEADRANGYREVMEEMAKHLPVQGGCVASRELGESERGMVDYYMGLVTLRIERDPVAAARCGYLIEQNRPRQPIETACAGGATVWSGSRHRSSGVEFRLCRMPTD